MARQGCTGRLNEMGQHSDTARPRLFVSSAGSNGVRTAEDIRDGLQDPYAAKLWGQLVEKVEHEKGEPVWTPRTALPGRSATQIEHGNREYELIAHTANRIMDASLVGLIRDDRQYAESALKQILCVYEEDQWPAIEDKTHLAHGDHCSLRSGQLALAIGCAFDWLYDLLDEEERASILEGFDRRFTKAYRAALESGDRWVDWRHNFCAVIYGGFAIAGMAFGDDYSESDWLVQTGKPAMDEYFASLFGPEGEFNESVQYAGSAATAVDYLMAQRCFSPLEEHPIAKHRFDAFCRWYMHFTLPPGRVAGFGDPAPDLPPVVFHYSAVASALRDPVFQWFYRQYADHTQTTHRKRSLELVFYDPTVEAQPPEGRLPRGHAYHAQGKLISSRSSWDSDTTVSVAYSKAAREMNHSHPDWGQVCLDGYGERLLRDLGSPPAYPRDDRDRYYNYQQWGHNVLVFVKNETGGVPIGKSDVAGDIVEARFDDARGGIWRMDLTDVYEEASKVTRTVVHLLPRVLVVVDEGELTSENEISLRWHTAAIPEMLGDGNLKVQGDRACLVGWVGRLDGEATLDAKQHAYVAPYNVDALGDTQPQRHEPYVELAMVGDRCRIVSLFCVEPVGGEPNLWRQADDGWEIRTEEGLVQVSPTQDGVQVRRGDVEWTV